MSEDVKAAAELVAIACAIKEKQLTELKRSLPRGTSIDVEVVARIKGVVQVGVDTPSTSTTRPIAPPHLVNANVVSEVLRRLKVTPPKLRQALRATLKPGPTDYTANEPNRELLDVFSEAAAGLVADLPPEPVTIPGRAGAVSVAATVQIIDPPRAKLAA